MGVWSDIGKSLLAAGVQAVANAIDEQQGKARNNGHGARVRQLCEDVMGGPEDLSRYSAVFSTHGIVFPRVTYGKGNSVFMAEWKSIVQIDVGIADNQEICAIQLRGGVLVLVPVGMCYPFTSLQEYKKRNAGEAMSDELFRSKMQEWDAGLSDSVVGMKVCSEWAQGFLNSVRVFHVLKQNEDENQLVSASSVIGRMELVSSYLGDNLGTGQATRVMVRFGLPLMILIDKLLNDLIVDSSRGIDRDAFMRIKGGIKKRQELVRQVRSRIANFDQNVRATWAQNFNLDFDV